MPRRGPRRAPRAPEVSDQTPAQVALDESARALARGGPPAHHGDRPVPRRDQLPIAVLGGTGSDHHPVHTSRVHRPRAPGAAATEGHSPSPQPERGRCGRLSRTAWNFGGGPVSGDYAAATIAASSV